MKGLQHQKLDVSVFFPLNLGKIILIEKAIFKQDFFRVKSLFRFIVKLENHIDKSPLAYCDYCPTCQPRYCADDVFA